MSNKVKGYLLGILASLAVVGLWIVLYVFAGIIAGLVGTLMGLAIIVIYKKFNPNDNSKVIYVSASLIAFFEIFLAEFLSVVIMCAREGIDLSLALANSKVVLNMVLDIVIAVGLSALVLFSYIKSENKKVATKQVVNQTSNEENKIEE